MMIQIFNCMIKEIEVWFFNESQTELNDLKIEQIFFLYWGDINSIETMIDSNAFKNLMANTLDQFLQKCVKSERHFLETQLSFQFSKKVFFLQKRGRKTINQIFN